MKILATQKVIDGSEINVLHRENDTWLLISKAEFDAGAQFDAEAISVIDEHSLYSRIPKLRGMLDQEDKTTINIDYSTGEINVNPQHFHFGIPTHGAKATRQINAGFSLLHYLRVSSSLLITPALILLGLFLGGFFLGWFLYIPFVLYGLFKYLELSKIRDMYYSGSLNPGIVIDAKNNKIASFTDMTLGRGTYPLIRVKIHPLPEQYRVDGQRIPVAGGYQSTENYSHWNYYEHYPLPSGIKDEDLINEKLNAISTIEWIRLEQEVNKFDGIPKEGYYPIEIGSTDWKDVNIEAIEWMQFGEEK